MLIWRHEDGPVLSLNTAAEGRSRACAGSGAAFELRKRGWPYLADAGAALKREWRANGERAHRRPAGRARIRVRGGGGCREATRRAARRGTPPPPARPFCFPSRLRAGGARRSRRGGGGDQIHPSSVSLARPRWLFRRARITELCARTCAWRRCGRKMEEEEEEDLGGGETALGSGNSRGRAAPADSPPTTDTAAAAFVADPRPPNSRATWAIGRRPPATRPTRPTRTRRRSSRDLREQARRRVRGFDSLGRSLGILRRGGVARAGGSVHAIGDARDATPRGRGGRRGHERRAWTRALTPALRKRGGGGGRAPGIITAVCAAARRFARGRWRRVASRNSPR